MQISITTDYKEDTGDPNPYLRRIADAGFSHIHWCHEWNTDHAYSSHEIRWIQKALSSMNLQLLDLHASTMSRADWASSEESIRIAGLDLARNRMQMTTELGSNTMVMHIPDQIVSTALRKSLDTLEPEARSMGVRIAIENCVRLNAIQQVLPQYSPDYLGLCYDSGHGNLFPEGISQLDSCKDRLLALHLHDNDGSSDQHKPLFSGTAPWQTIARIIAESSYKKCISMEVSMRNSGYTNEIMFLEHCKKTGIRLTQMMPPAMP